MKNIEKKDIKIDKFIIKAAFLALVCAILITFGIQHYSKFTFIPITPTSYSSDGRLIINQSLDSREVKLATITQNTPFGTEIKLNTNGLTERDMVFAGGNFHPYSNMIFIYFNSVFTDFKFLILIWLSITSVFIFFKRFKIKFT